MNRNSSGRRYDREFKNNAVALVRGGRTITEVARDLGVSKWSLGHWGKSQQRNRACVISTFQVAETTGFKGDLRQWEHLLRIGE